MSCNIKSLPLFDKAAKKFAKKHPSFKKDFQGLLKDLNENPYLGVDLGRNLRKVRLAISSKGKGKSGGARVITLVVEVSEDMTEIGLQYIYDKSERESVTDKELTEILKRNGLL